MHPPAAKIACASTMVAFLRSREHARVELNAGETRERGGAHERALAHGVAADLGVRHDKYSVQRDGDRDDVRRTYAPLRLLERDIIRVRGALFLPHHSRGFHTISVTRALAPSRALSRALLVVIENSDMYET